MTSTAGCRCDQRSSATNEGAVTSSGNDHEGFTTLNSGGLVAGISIVLVNSEGLASDGGLIDLEEGVFSNDAAVGGNDGTFFNLKNVTWNDFRGFDFLEFSVTENGSLKSECLLQFLDDRSSLEFLDETDGGVKQKECADDTEIYPILKTSGEDSGALRRLMLVCGVV
jgi:hypothetical protein